MKKELSFNTGWKSYFILFGFFLFPYNSHSRSPATPSFSWDQLRYGNHRVALEVTKAKDAVYARIPWRRRDQHPELKKMILTDSSGKEITNILPLTVTREYGEIIFQPVSGPGTYYLYYMPFEMKGSRNYPKVYYLKPEYQAGVAWLDKNKLTDSLKIRKRIRRLPAATVAGIEAVNDFNSFDPMEYIATAAEVKQLLQQHPEEYLLFPESRRYPIRMRDDLPVRWIKKGVTHTFSATAYRNEYYAFQIGLYAARDSLQDVEITFEGLRDAGGKEVLPAKAFTCFNKTGTGWDARPFVKKIPVPQGTVQPLWIGVDIP